jgi:hypothetical protein
MNHSNEMMCLTKKVVEGEHGAYRQMDHHFQSDGINDQGCFDKLSKDTGTSI